MRPPTTCPVCENTELTIQTEVIDHSVSKTKFQLLACTQCELVVTSPQPATDEIRHYYQSQDYISHTSRGNNLINKLYLAVRRFTLRHKVSLLARYVNGGTLLDYGCGTGHFLAEAKNAGWITYGIEPVEDVRQQIFHTPVYERLAQLPRSTFSAVTLWHVLEHIPDLNKELRDLASRLEKSGKIFVAVPNYKSLDARQYKNYWAAYDVPRHLWHFSRETITRLAANHSLSVLDILPMPLDAYYISLLSEKYQGSKAFPVQLLSAFLSGLRSNQDAKRTGEFSSLLYVLSK